MQFGTLFTVIFVLAAMVGIGAWLVRSGSVSFQPDVRKTFMAIIIHVTMPCIILHSVLQLTIDERLLIQMAVVLAISVGVNCLGIAVGWLGSGMLKISSRKRREMAILSGLGNTATMGIPLCAALFGSEGALLAAVFDSGVDIVIWTVAVFLLQEGPRFSASRLKVRINMPLIAILSGIAISTLSIPVPDAIGQLVAILSQATVPMAMLYIGMQLASSFDRRKMADYFRSLWNPFLIKLIVFPCIVIALLALANVRGEVSQIVVIQASMPTLTLASILFAYCAADEEFAAVTTAYSTVLSPITVPVMVLLSGFFINGV
jgi:hypothetical protein